MREPILLTLCPLETDGTSLYRGVGPLGVLRKQIPLNIYSPQDINWATMAKSDACFMQRPFSADQLACFDAIKNNGLKVWVDYDDDLFNLSPKNCAFRVYNDPKIRNSVMWFLENADFVTVATHKLKSEYDKYRRGKSGCVVVPNAWNDFLQGYRPTPLPLDPSPYKTIVWRGGQNNVENLEYFFEPLLATLKDLPPEWKFIAIGDVPYEIEQAVPEDRFQKIDFIPCCSEYLRVLYRLRPTIMVSLLKKHPFFEAKSNICFIEGVVSGAAVMAASYMPEFQKPGVLTYDDPDDFAKKLKMLCADAEQIKIRQETSWEYIKENLRLSRVNSLRKKILDEMMK